MGGSKRGSIKKEKTLNCLNSRIYMIVFDTFVERMRLELITSTLPVSRSSQMS